MTNPKALETFGAYDKKSLMAGITVGQGLKGRARAPQTPAPAGFPQDLWDAASERANNMIAQLQAEKSGETPSEPETPDDWQFDKDAFCFGVAAGRSLEGWEIDGAINFSGFALTSYYIHIENPDTVYITFYLAEESLDSQTAYINWGDGSARELIIRNGYIWNQFKVPHAYHNNGDYIITLCSKHKITLCGGPFFDTCGVYIKKGEGKDGYNVDILCAVYCTGDILLGGGAFGRCNSLSNATLLRGMRVIGDYSFFKCPMLRSIVIPPGVTDITFAAFYLSGVTDCIIPDSVTYIGFYALEMDHGMNVYYSGTEAQWNAIDFGSRLHTNITIHYNSTGPDDVHDD